MATQQVQQAEQIPLKTDPEGKTADEEAPKDFVAVSKVKLFIALAVLIILIIIIIVLAAFLGAKGHQRRRHRDEDDGSVDKGDGDKHTTPTLAPGPWDKLRLPRSVIPSHYDLHLNVDPNQDGYNGRETITVNVNDETSYLLIHSNGLNITEASVQNAESSKVSIKNHFDAKKNDFHVIETAKPLTKGKYMLEYKFHRLYRTSLFGLFKGDYRQNDGKMAAFLSTQLEPIDARTMFPCFDEPALKATFKISLSYPKDMIGLSNGEEEKSKVKDQTKTTYYKTTPIMSVYLVSVVVGHFQSKKLTTSGGVELRAFAQPGNTDQMDFALRMGNETLTQMEQIFGIKYPMKKLDFVAPPECYIAMENWGSVRFEEDGLLYKKDFSSEEIQQNLLIRWLVHEIVHMWFGNYVTMKWWDDLWLNEAVTDFYTYFDGSPKGLKSWKRDLQFVHTNLGYALDIDGYVSSRPVIVPLDAPTVDMFDNIVYKKGSSLLNMLKHFYPKKQNFNLGMKNYLNSFAYSNAVSDDMWNSLQSTCPVKECPNIREVMQTWMYKKNYPVLTIKKTGDGKYIVQQERFVYDKTAKLDKLLWRVHFNYFVSATDRSKATPSRILDRWMTDKSSNPVEQVEIQWDGKGWIKGNIGQIGYYRVNYDDTNWGKLADQLSYYHLVFSPADRYGLIDDAFNLVRGERVSIKRALDLTKYIKREEDYLPWMAVQKNIDYILGILPHHGHTVRHLKRYMAYQTQPLYKKLGYKNTGSHLEKLLRMIAVDYQCRAGYTSCIGNMTKMFGEWKKDPLTSSLTPALRKLVYFYGIRHGTSQDWNLVLQQLQKNNIASEFQPLMMGLAGARQIGDLSRYLELMNNETIIKEQFLKYVLDDIANHNPDGADVMWTFLKYNWNRLKTNNPVAAMMKYLPIVTKRFSTTSKLNDLEKLINDNLNGQSIPRVVQRAVEIVKLNIAWRKAHESQLEEWLQEFLKNIPSGDKAGFGDAA